MEAKSLKFQMMLEPSLAKAIDDFGFENRIRTRAQAIRLLIRKSLVDISEKEKGEA